MFARPKPKLETVALELLRFDPALQQRAGLDSHAMPSDADSPLARACWRESDSGELVCCANPEIVAQLREALAEGETFDPLEVAVETRKGRQPIYWVFGGFTRGAAYTLAGVGSVRCHLYDGTHEDALFWSLSENYLQVQSRGRDSVRKSIETLIDHPELVARCRAEATGNGGLGRAIAAACRCSPAMVHRVLTDSNLRVVDMRIVPRLEPKPEPKTAENKTKPSEHSSNCLATSGQTPVRMSQEEPPEPEPPEPEQAKELPAVEAEQIEAPEPEPEAPATGEGELARAKVIRAQLAVDAVIRAAKELDERFRDALATMAGVAIRRVTFDEGRDHLVTRVNNRYRAGGGAVERAEESAGVPPHMVLSVMRRIRPLRVCAACAGEGCTACKLLGYVPSDSELINPDKQLAFDFDSQE